MLIEPSTKALPRDPVRLRFAASSNLLPGDRLPGLVSLVKLIEAA